MGTVELMALCLEDIFEGPQVRFPPHVLIKKARPANHDLF